MHCDHAHDPDRLVDSLDSTAGELLTDSCRYITNLDLPTTSPPEDHFHEAQNADDVDKL